MSTTNNELVNLGKIGAPYGIKGWVKINSYTEVQDGIFEYSPWKIAPESIRGKATSEQTVKVVDWRRHNKGLIAKFENVNTREQAELLVNYVIYVSAQELPELEQDEIYWRDLIGMQVVGSNTSESADYQFGKVSGLMETGSNDVLVVKANANDKFGQKERLIPYLLDQVIKQIDKDNNVILVDWDPEF